MSASSEDDDEKKPAGPVYTTPEGFARLKNEYEHLGGVERPRVVQGVSDAAAEGDRSENAEYIYGKKRLREIDRRMRFLRKILEAVMVVDPAVDRGDTVFFGATVVLEDDAGETFTYQLVGEHETDAQRGRISYRSPIGAALLRKSVDDEVVVDTPRGRRKLTIVEVIYR
ncbi:transcription elongation factor GreB [Sandaracinus amylolyticus]|uniref:Transcription elongation factor GreB n=1 Tax=Sandaracinus amylolyticus TaxID=927083 RepID=A0A0F6YJL1_9BACT|nr:transcription elongation factor GreB [Sandaracinus amylolyticus]AKF08188.1 Transcription elongation factor GreB [Sandaracinus amylolyticus]